MVVVIVVRKTTGSTVTSTEPEQQYQAGWAGATATIGKNSTM